ncbi:monovalent cation/H+ antiporter subunit D [Paracoccus sulfuroxidans]|uniref:Multisubunit potassium/proton antiporter, PhaD subunit (TC 2.A.63.1.1) n=1 Tax=Paracoccus sulfuroxidans TaxID=384678 RepID=A0A562NQQ5_9RHOB|nr:monovalent cation/H+ antiporter subunit D [Paracoccus sulfuroxidans]TWI34400.1 multisubunit potassium/proton antiporter, PhaD subunit (TC 2.A.63.1.1) [Paracoccus sulfuroxidans]
MNHLMIAPVLLPAVLGALQLLWMRGDLPLQRVFSSTGTALLVVVALILLGQASAGEVMVYRLGNWAAPFGIVLMLDRLAAMMVLLTSVVALIVQIYAIGSGWDRKGWHFHALWQFQLMGVCGAFLTGDAFNLFVFFEILLIASYGLMTHGGGEMRVRAGVQYVVVNLAGSALFLVALGVLYAVTGTLNMADMAARVAQMPPEDTALLRTGAVLIMLVFAIKAALVPLHFWLPSTYGNAPGPVAALFAIMTKVGVYAIIRFFTLIFPHDTVAGTLASEILLPAALITLAVGQIGIMGSRQLLRVGAFAALGSVGTLMIAVSQMNAEAMTAAIYYMVHSTLAAATLFLVLDLSARWRGDYWLRAGTVMPQSGLVSALFFAAAVAVVGLPPFSGFIGKLMVLDATAGAPAMPLIWSVILVTSLIALVGMSRVGTKLYLKPFGEVVLGGGGGSADFPTAPLRSDEPAPWLSVTAIMALLATVLALTVFAGPATRFAQATADQLYDPALYLKAVLADQEGTK